MISLALSLPLSIAQIDSAPEAPAEFSFPSTVDLYGGGTGSLLVGLVPSSRNGATWDDTSGAGRHITWTGSPATDEESPMASVILDGVNDRGDWTGTAFADTDLTIFVAMKVLSWPSVGSYEGILELSDTSGSDRSHWLYAYGSSNSIGLRTGDSTGAISFTTSGDSPAVFDDWVVVRISVTANTRSVWVNGVYRGASAAIKTAKNVTKIRIGNRVAGDVSYGNFEIAAVGIYSGLLAEQEVIDIEDDLFDRLSITPPFDYADIPAATNTTDPPEFTTFLGDMHVIADMPIIVEKNSLTAYDGRGVTLDTFDYDGPYVEYPVRGKYILTPPSGATNLTLEHNGEFWFTGIHGHALPTTGKRYVAIIGDSNVNRMRTGLAEMIYRILGSSLIEFVGSVAAESGYHAATTGYDSYVLDNSNVAGAAGAFLAAGSPLYAGGASLNMAGFFASLSHAPTHLILCCMQNAPYLASEATVDAALDAEKTAAQTILDAAGLAIPGLKMAVMTEWPLVADPAAYGGSWAAREVYHRKMRKAAFAAMQVPGGVIHGTVDVISTFPHVAMTRPYQGWRDSVHPSVLGHEQLLPMTLGWLAHRW